MALLNSIDMFNAGFELSEAAKTASSLLGQFKQLMQRWDELESEEENSEEENSDEENSDDEAFYSLTPSPNQAKSPNNSHHSSQSSPSSTTSPNLLNSTTPTRRSSLPSAFGTPPRVFTTPPRSRSRSPSPALKPASPVPKPASPVPKPASPVPKAPSPPPKAVSPVPKAVSPPPFVAIPRKKRQTHIFKEIELGPVVPEFIAPIDLSVLESVLSKTKKWSETIQNFRPSVTFESEQEYYDVAFELNKIPDFDANFDAEQYVLQDMEVLSNNIKAVIKEEKTFEFIKKHVLTEEATVIYEERKRIKEMCDIANTGHSNLQIFLKILNMFKDDKKYKQLVGTYVGHQSNIFRNLINLLQSVSRSRYPLPKYLKDLICNTNNELKEAYKESYNQFNAKIPVQKIVDVFYSEALSVSQIKELMTCLLMLADKTEEFESAGLRFEFKPFKEIQKIIEKADDNQIERFGALSKCIFFLLPELRFTKDVSDPAKSEMSIFPNEEFQQFLVKTALSPKDAHLFTVSPPSAIKETNKITIPWINYPYETREKVTDSHGNIEYLVITHPIDIMMELRTEKLYSVKDKARFIMAPSDESDTFTDLVSESKIKVFSWDELLSEESLKGIISDPEAIDFCDWLMDV